MGAIGGFGIILFGLAGSLIEPFLVMALYVGTGVSAIVSPFIGQNKTVGRIWAIGTLLVGLVWIMLSFTLFYSHVGFFPQPDGSYK